MFHLGFSKKEKMFISIGKISIGAFLILKNSLELVNTLIKNPIVIKTKNDINENKISETLLHEYIIDDIDNFLKELGTGFTYIGHEVKIKINNNYHSIDFLLYNYEFNCFIVCEIKITK